MTEELVSQLPQREMLGQRGRYVVGWALWQLTKSVLGVEVSQTTLDNFRAFNEHLKEGPAIMYAFHPDKVDAALTTLMARAMAPNLVRAVGPVGVSQYYAPGQNTFFETLGKLVGIHGMPVVRSSSTKDQRYAKDKDRLVAELHDETAIGLQTIGWMYGLAPSGTRGNVLTVHEKDSFVKISRDIDNIGYFPYGFARNKIGRREAFLGEKVDMSDWSTMTNEAIVEMLMLRLAAILPEYARGVYGDML